MGQFSILLGEVSAIGDAAFSGPDRWLSVQVESDPEMSPRVQLTTVPYSHRISTIDGASGGTIYGELNIEWSTAAQKAMAPGQHNFKIGSNIDLTAAEYTMAVGQNHVGASNNALIIGDADTVRGDYSMILGTYSAIGEATGAFIVGSLNRVEDGSHRSVIIGAINYAQGYDNICFGLQDSIKESSYSSILGGSRNKIIKGSNNSIISGGENRISGAKSSTISGGERNRIDSTDNGDVAFINASIGGGSDNIASENGATVGGGQSNKATKRQTTVAGGIFNEATGEVAAVGGGQSNSAAGDYATVPGGFADTASGAYSFAAGNLAKAAHQGTFVWADNTGGQFASSGDNQFLIRADGGVGINTNDPAGYTLHVAGNVDADAFSINGTPIGTGGGYWSLNGSDIYYNSGNVGIGTSTPAAKLHVVGGIMAIGDVILDGAINSPTDTNYAEIVIRGAGGDDTCMVITSDGNRPGIMMYDGSGHPILSATVDATGNNAVMYIIDGATNDTLGVWTEDGIDLLDTADTSRLTLGANGTYLIDTATDDTLGVWTEDGIDLVDIADSTRLKMRANGTYLINTSTGDTLGVWTEDGIDLLDTADTSRLKLRANGIVVARTWVDCLRLILYADNDSTLVAYNSYDLTGNIVSEHRYYADNDSSVVAYNQWDRTTGDLLSQHKYFADDDSTLVAFNWFERTTGNLLFQQKHFVDDGSSVVAYNSFDGVSRVSGTRLVVDTGFVHTEMSVSDKTVVETIANEDSTTIVMWTFGDSLGRLKLKTDSDGARITATDFRSGNADFGVDPTSGPYTRMINAAGTDSTRITAAEIVLAYSAGDAGYLTAGGLTFKNSLGNTSFEARGDNGTVILYDNSGIEKLRLSKNGIAYDTASVSPSSFSTINPGGTRIFSNIIKSTGVHLIAGAGSWSTMSDRNQKENVVPVDVAEALEMVAQMPLNTWNYKSQDESIRHMGPMAQDLHAAFGLGIDDKHINTIDADGIALAAIQGLHQENVDLKDRVEQLEALVKQLLENQQ